MSTFIFDTGALSLFYAEDLRLRSVVDRIDSGRSTGFLSSVTLSEFHYKACQKVGREVADLWSRQLGERMRIVQVGAELSLAAGVEKCRNNRLSLADAHALALSRSVRGTLVTTDSELAKERAVKVSYFRP